MLLDIYPQKISDFGVDCRINSVSALLRYYNYHITTQDAFLLSGSFTTIYGEVSLNASMKSKSPLIVASNNYPELGVLNALDCKYCVEQFDQSEASWEKIKQLLARGTPLLTRVDEDVLSHSTKPQRIDIHFISIPILCGYNESESEVYLFWTNTQHFAFPVSVNKAKFDTYRNVFCRPFPPDNQCVYLLETPEFSDAEIDKRIRHSIFTTAFNMLHSSYNNNNIATSDFCENTFFGMKAIEALRHYFVSSLKMLLVSRRSDILHKRMVLSCLSVRMGLLKGSFSANREEFSQALITFGIRNGDKTVIKTGKKMLALSRVWKRLIFILGSYSHSSRVQVLRILQICCFLFTIEKREYRVYKKLVEHYGAEFNI